MKLEHEVRACARALLPAGIRRPLGSLAGHVRTFLFYPLLGLIFDLKGGRFRADGCVFAIPKDITSLEFRACFLTKTYEADERMLIQKHLLPEDSVLELGACLGIVSCVTNKLLRDPARHVVVEANPYCIPAIYRNRNLNRASFLVEHCAVGNQTKVQFYLNPAHITSGTGQTASAVSVVVPGRSLEELNARYGPFSTLVMDIEGAELAVLEASQEKLKDFRLVIIELHEWIIGPNQVARCRRILEQAGFNLAERSYITEVWLRT